jgi:hypothetical protein
MPLGMAAHRVARWETAGGPGRTRLMTAGVIILAVSCKRQLART